MNVLLHIVLWTVIFSVFFYEMELLARKCIPFHKWGKWSPLSNGSSYDTRKCVRCGRRKNRLT